MSIVIIAIIAVICSAAGCYAGYSITSKIVRNKKASGNLSENPVRNHPESPSAETFGAFLRHGTATKLGSRIRFPEKNPYIYTT